MVLEEIDEIREHFEKFCQIYAEVFIDLKNEFEFGKKLVETEKIVSATLQKEINELTTQLIGQGA